MKLIQYKLNLESSTCYWFEVPESEIFLFPTKIYILMRIIVLVSSYQFWTLSSTNSIVDIKIPNSRNCQVFSLACGDEIIVKLSELSFHWIYILTKFLFPSRFYLIFQD